MVVRKLAGRLWLAVFCAGCVALPASQLSGLAPGAPGADSGAGAAGSAGANGGLTQGSAVTNSNPAAIPGLVSNNAGSLVSNNTASLAGSVLAPAALISNNGNNLVSNGSANFRVSSLDAVPLQRALIYLSDTRERLYLDPASGAVLTTTTDDQGKFRFDKAPGGDTVVVNAVLSGN
ncbi:MAG: hypothetical protein FJZ00_03485, partial [Candidatus Sericytochromatia bacterium]|nr:hypothetical protein [Candidatus Tanganyikabacteria bacterium]